MKRFLTFSVLFFLILLTPVIAQDELFRRAVELERAGSAEAALSLFRQAAEEKSSPLADYSQFEVARNYFEKADYKAAIPEYFKLINSFHDSILLPQANLLMGKCYLKLKNYPRAIKTFKYLVGKFPEADEAAEARYLIAAGYTDQKKWKEAYLAYEETDLYCPLSSFGHKARSAITLLKKQHRKKLPIFKASAPALYKQGMAYFNQGDYEMSANIFNRLAREFPKSKYTWEALLMLGKSEYQSNSSLAISDLQLATSGPSNLAGIAHYYLGLSYGRRGDYPKAIASMKKVTDNYPSSGLADEAAYWSAYYLELSGDKAAAMLEYYNLINNYPCSKTVPSAIWRIGKIYYWNSEFKNAANYLHLAQVYPTGEDTPRCLYFEAKALERQSNLPAALEIYKKLIKNYDHTYYAYRARERLISEKINFSEEASFSGSDFNEALNDLNAGNPDALAAIMEIWEQTQISEVLPESTSEVQSHLGKYKALMNMGLSDYAAGEAHYLVNFTSDLDRESAQARLGEMLVSAGEYSRPIRFADRKVKNAILSGTAGEIPKNIWKLAFPKGYWKSVEQNAADYRVDPYLVLAVIREESRFNPKAVSHSSARGLMQIMPGTGRAIAKDLDLKRYRTRKLYEPKLNIAMGTYYLANLVHNFQNNIYLALAGYNGGPNKIKRFVNSWYNGKMELVDIDEFVESIPSRETRLYVQKVMGSYFEYKRLYDRKRG